MPLLLPLFFVIFIGVPLIEIYLLIKVGGTIGALSTVFAVLFTAVLGVTLIRIQGFSTMQKAQQSMAQGITPAEEIYEGMLLFFAALCLLMPGFFTDSIGFLLLIPPLRSVLAKRFLKTGALRYANIRNAGRTHSESDYFDGEYEDLTPEQQHERNQSRLKHQHIIEGSVEDTDKDHK